MDSDLHPDLRRSARLAVVAGFGLLLLAAIATIIVALSGERAETAANHSRDVRQAQSLLFSTVQDAETGQRGYLLTGDPKYLSPFNEAQARLPEIASTLRTLIGEDTTQQRRLDVLTADIDAKMRELELTNSRQSMGDSAAALAIVRTDEGRLTMGRIRSESAAFDTAETMTIEARQASAGVLRAVLLGLILIALAVIAVLGWFVGREWQRFTTELGHRNNELQNEIKHRGRAEAQLRQAQKMEALGQLTGGIAHDFNNMLAIIVGNLDMVIRRFPAGHDRLQEMADSALAGAHRAAALTKRLLAFSRLQPLCPKSTDINKSVGDMSELLRRSLGERYAVETVLAGGLWRAFVDCPQLESAILNVSVNARDAMPDGGSLTIETSNASLDKQYADQNAEVEPGQYVLIAITDTGAGMSPETLEKVFEPFFTTKPAGKGTGLGLSQVHGFLKQSRGHVKLYSEVGVGTTVKFYLPRDTMGSAAEVVRHAPTPATNKDFTLLVVEDDPGVREFVVGAARELGFRVMDAGNAAVALERLESDSEITLMLTDVVMPGVTRRELANQALQLRPDLVVIYMTGYTRNAIVHNNVLDAGTRLMTKPFTVADLDRELTDALAHVAPAVLR